MEWSGVEWSGVEWSGVSDSEWVSKKSNPQLFLPLLHSVLAFSRFFKKCMKTQGVTLSVERGVT